MIRDAKLKQRKRYRLRHTYELLEGITGLDRKRIRKRMFRLGLGNDAEDFVQYIKIFMTKESK